MGKPTVNDIAREAGVSLATVDRVLNARPGVRPKTISAVNDAISRLGYVRDIAAANLARGRNYHFAVVVPASSSQFVGTLVAALDEAAAVAAASRTTVELLRYPPEDVHALAALLSGLSAEVTGVALMAPETPVVRDVVNSLRARGIPVVTLVSDLPNTGRSHFVGIDSHAAGRTAGLLMGRCLSGRTGQIMVLAQSMLLRDSIERRRGFDEVMQESFPGVEVLQTLESHGSSTILREAMAEVIRSEGLPGGIYLLGSGYRALSDALVALDLSPGPIVIGHDLTPYARSGLEAGWLHAVVTQNIGHLARSALRVLRARADGLRIDEEQERLRIEILIRENLPPDVAAGGADL